MLLPTWSKVRNIGPIRIVYTALVWLFLSSNAVSDVLPVNAAAFAPNIAEMRITDNKIDLQLEVYVGDLGIFRELVPLEWQDRNAAGSETLPQRLQAFAEQKLILRANGLLLVPELLTVEPRRRKDRRIQVGNAANLASSVPIARPPEDDRVMFVHLRYDLPPGTSTVEITPPMQSDGRPSVNIGFITIHQDVPVTDYWYLTDQETLHLDWQDPWYSAYANKTLKRHQNSPALTYLYVDPREVRYETLIRLRDLSDWLSEPLPDTTELDATDQSHILSLAETLFLGFDPIRIDGEEHHPSAIRSQFMEITTSGLVLAEEGRNINKNTAMVGIILSYPTRVFPDHVEARWALFNERIATINAVAIDPSGPLADRLTQDRPALVWQNKLLTYTEPKVDAVRLYPPSVLNMSLLSMLLGGGAMLMLFLSVRTNRWRRLVSMGCVVAFAASAVAVNDRFGPTVTIPLGSPITKSEGEEVLGVLLREVGDAYLETDLEQRIIRVSPLTVSASQEELMAEFDRGLTIRVAGGGVAKVSEISDLKLSEFRTLHQGTGFSAIAEWMTTASGNHWGHNHIRNVRFRALVELDYLDRAWRLSGMTVLQANLELES